MLVARAAVEMSSDGLLVSASLPDLDDRSPSLFEQPNRGWQRLAGRAIEEIGGELLLLPHIYVFIMAAMDVVEQANCDPLVTDEEFEAAPRIQLSVDRSSQPRCGLLDRAR